MTPEEQARAMIDEVLQQAGWVIQDRINFNRTESLGVAVREFLMVDNTEADYLLFVGGKAIGVIEAKAIGTCLAGAEFQSKSYAAALPNGVRSHLSPLPFILESNGEEFWFRDNRDTNSRSRRIFAIYKPETFLEWIGQPQPLRNRFQSLPKLNQDGLRKCQIDAINGLEDSLSNNQPRSLIHMATGAGKTFTACNIVYRLLESVKAKRVLFLVDRNNLGRQTKQEFDQYHVKDENRLFKELYNVQHLQHNKIDKDAKVVITTIQRLYSMLIGESDLEEISEETSAYQQTIEKPKEIKYNPSLPIEFFDFIIVDECHRSIYGDWRQILEYFDAFIIGLTATPSQHTLGYFNNNLVAQYSYENSVIDKVNVDFETYKIRTQIGEHGSTVKKGFTLPKRNRLTRKMIYEQLKDDLVYTKNALDHSVVVPDQIRTVLQTYKNSVFTELFPDREQTFIPKTLIFAKDDNHAEEIVRITRKVFNKDNEFCKKITYNISGETSDELIKKFRTDPSFRIAVTVDMIATGTDIKPLEVIIFMRDVHSDLYYEQMKGRGVRTINPTALREVTPNARSKTHFYLIDAVGVTERQRSASQPLERKRSVALKKLIEQISQGNVDDDIISSVAKRIAVIEANSDRDSLKRITNLADGKALTNIAKNMYDSIDPDKVSDKTDEEILAIKDEAVKYFNNPEFRNTLLDLGRKSFIIIDDLSIDTVISSEKSKDKAVSMVSNFKEFVEQNKDQITALSIIYNMPHNKRYLTYQQIKDLEEKMLISKPPLAISEVWRAYTVIEHDNVRRVSDPARILTNLVQLVRFAFGLDKVLDDFSTVATSRYNLWIGRQIKKGITYTDEQKFWLTQIKDHIISNASISSDDIQDAMSDNGGIVKARKLFGSELEPLLEDLSITMIG